MALSSATIFTINYALTRVRVLPPSRERDLHRPSRYRPPHNPLSRPRPLEKRSKNTMEKIRPRDRSHHLPQDFHGDFHSLGDYHLGQRSDPEDSPEPLPSELVG